MPGAAPSSHCIRFVTLPIHLHISYDQSVSTAGIEHVLAIKSMIEEIPDDLDNIRSLKSFTFVYCRATNLPIGTRALVNLRDLCVSNAGLVELPSWLCELKNLESM